MFNFFSWLLIRDKIFILFFSLCSRFHQRSTDIGRLAIIALIIKVTHLPSYTFFSNDARSCDATKLFVYPTINIPSYEIAINGVQFWDATRISRRISEITRQLLFDTFNCGDILRPRVSRTEANARRGSLTVRSFIYATSDKWSSLDRPGRRDYALCLDPYRATSLWFSFNLESQYLYREYFSDIKAST